MPYEERFSQDPEVISLKRTPIPLVNSFLASLRNENIYFTEEDIYHLLKDSSQLDFSYLMSLANRYAGDNTGILGHLVGVSRDPNHTERIVSRIGEQILSKLRENPNYKAIISLLNNQIVSNVSEATFIIIDDLAKETIEEIKGVAYASFLTDEPGQQTPEATAFKVENEQILRLLIEEYGGIDRLLNRSCEIETRYVTKISQAPTVPRLNITPLLNILPDQLNRNIPIYEQAPTAEDPLGFIARVNMAGSGPFRILAARARDIREAKKVSRL